MPNFGSVQDDPTGFENRTDSGLSFSTITNLFSVTPTGTEFSYWIKGVRYTKDAEVTVTITTEEGLHYVYFDGIDLVVTRNFTSVLITDYALVAAIYRDMQNNVYQIFDERHGHKMPGSVHLYLHRSQKAQYLSGLLPGDFTISSGNDDNDALFSVSSGVIVDEDISIDVAGVGRNMGGDKEVYYMGPLGFLRWYSNRIAPVLNGPNFGDRLVYNDIVTGDLNEVTDGNYVLCHIIALNNGRLAFFVGQKQYNNAVDAREGIKTEAAQLYYGILASLTAEFVLVGSVIYQTRSSYNNLYKARIVEVSSGVNYWDWRTTKLVGNGGTSMLPAWAVVPTSSPTITAANGQFIIMNHPTGVITLPNSTLGARIGVKAGTAPAATMYVKTQPAKMIDGVVRSGAGLAITTIYKSYVFVGDGSDWWIESTF